MEDGFPYEVRPLRVAGHPFGLTGAPATFQRYINRTLQEYLDEFCSAYIDDVLIYSSGSLSDHRKKVRKVLQRLQEAGLQVDIDKCDFEVKSVKYLGFIVEAGKGIRVDPEKIRAVETVGASDNCQGSQGLRRLRQLLPGVRPRLLDYSHAPDSTYQEGCPLHLVRPVREAFQRLKTLLISAPVLAQWDPDRKTVVETDSLGYAVGGALSQYDDDGTLRPSGLLFEENNPAECNYPIYDKELLAVICCLEQWDAELRSVPSFEVWTDHKNLEYFYKKQQLSERQVR